MSIAVICVATHLSTNVKAFLEISAPSSLLNTVLLMEQTSIPGTDLEQHHFLLLS
jgi:hypothetical protein